MKLIVGLGNPGKKYERTRHNAAWLILDWLIEDLGLVNDASWQKKFDSKILHSEHSDYVLVKPQTFMNKSGKAVKAICDFYKIEVKKDLLIIHDDTDLPFATIKATESSSSAGHNGVQDIIEKLDSQDFHRIRIGVDARASRLDVDTEIYVLQPFSDDELKKLHTDVFPKVKLEIEKFIGNWKLEIGNSKTAL